MTPLLKKIYKLKCYIYISAIICLISRVYQVKMKILLLLFGIISTAWLCNGGPINLTCMDECPECVCTLSEFCPPESTISSRSCGDNLACCNAKILEDLIEEINQKEMNKLPKDNKNIMDCLKLNITEPKYNFNYKYNHAYYYNKAFQPLSNKNNNTEKKPLPIPGYIVDTIPKPKPVEIIQAVPTPSTTIRSVTAQPVTTRPVPVTPRPTTSPVGNSPVVYSRPSLNWGYHGPSVNSDALLGAGLAAGSVGVIGALAAALGAAAPLAPLLAFG